MLIMIRGLIIHPRGKRSFHKDYSVCALLQGYKTMLIYPTGQVMFSHYLTLLRALLKFEYILKPIKQSLYRLQS